MPLNRLPRRDPRTVARDIPGVLDILFPRLTGGLVSSLNKKTFSFAEVDAVSEELIGKSYLQKAMLFELAAVRAEFMLHNNSTIDWNDCLEVAADRQRQHYDAKIPVRLDKCDIEIAEHAAGNLVSMLKSVGARYPNDFLEHHPLIPGLGWIASGRGDYSLGPMLIEVKHSEQNFRSGDFRQVLMYWLLKYARSVEKNDAIWSELLLLNPRRNSALIVNFNFLLSSASARLNQIELIEILRSAVGQENILR